MARFTETSVIVYRISWPHIQEEYNIYILRRENLRSYVERKKVTSRALHYDHISR
jgi:hypothetical protein